MADIKKENPQIWLAEKDRHAARFLVMDVIKDQEDKISDKLKILILFLKCSIYGFNDNPFFLAATITKHMQKFKYQYRETF